MSQQHISVRLPPEMIEKVDAYRKKMESASKQRQTRADALRSLIAHGLEAAAKR